MNDKGQTLILFLLIMPIIAGFLAFFIDISIVNYEKNKLDGIILNNLDIIVEKDIRDIDKIKNVFIENEILINDVFIDGNVINVEVNTKVKSLFGKILDFDIYKFNITYKGDYLDKVVSKVR